MSVLSYIFILLFIAGIVYAFVCRKKSYVVPAKSQVRHPDWSKNAVIYEVNIRQFTYEGTFKAFEKHLPRLKQMGVDILWIMPVHPIGIKERLGKLGSYYSVKDYKAINPEFGTMDDFKHLVSQIHKTGMRVILDWVANHTSWDNDLTIEHPEYYYKDQDDGLRPPVPDWKDVIQLNFYNPETRQYMTKVMKWWVQETDIDGFRCDIAGMVLKEFWETLYFELFKFKHVFMLAEADIPEYHEKGFDMSYDWKFHHLMNDIAKGRKKASAVMKHFEWFHAVYPGNSYLMQFTSNHDENSWNGSEYERLGEGAKAFAVLAATVEGMLLIYSGQESAFNRRLKFFEKDCIQWDNYLLWQFYHKLIALKKRNNALWNGDDGGKMIAIPTNQDSSVVVFSREVRKDKVFVFINLTAKKMKVKCRKPLPFEMYTEIFTQRKRNLGELKRLTMNPWEFLVYEKEN